MSDKPASPYLVLARKYRPQSFESLIGQDAMVQTFANAFRTGRIHHAFILTGVRGVGKTTTARILARAFNYVDETGPHPTLDLASEGEHCRAIIEGRHVDVMEMDAASNTGINDIREIIDSVKYGPVSAPYKVYIIDEVHMLSNQAFNGLLKTLEEPPPYVKFIFATTEIRKVPVTILSRCQRFDLRRVPADLMTTYLDGILGREGVSCAPDALSMIVRAGEGSVRDCLSLLDQAIAHGGGEVSAQTVQSMLGLADRGRIIDLFEALMSGNIVAALDGMRSLYDSGADPQAIVGDLADFTHLVTRLKVVPASADDPGLTPDEKSRGSAFADKLGMRILTRTWQILLAGINEVAHARNAIQTAEMVLIRLAYAADLPTPDEVIERLRDNPADSGHAPVSHGSLPPRGAPGSVQSAVRSAPSIDPAPSGAPRAVAAPESLPQPASYTDLVALAAERRDLVIRHALEADLRPVSFEVGRIEVALEETANPAIIATLSARLKTWTGRPWMISVTTEKPAVPTLREARAAQEQERLSAAHDDPLVKAVLETFPGARVVNVRVRDDLQSGEMPDGQDPDITGIDPEEN
ncbi:MAG TPA: DNA polymerase III subunit gamma/tau [Devosiaceae bacterium]